MSARTRALFYALFALLVGGLAYWLGVGSLLGQRAEASVLGASAFTENPPAPLSLVSPVSLLIALCIIALIALWSHGIARAVTILLFGAAAVVASQLLKENWLERPQLFEFDAANTFPSGHMAVFSVITAGAIWAMPRSTRGLMTWAGALLMAVVSWQLLEYGWHRPSDLIGAQALVLFAFAVAAWIGPRRSRRKSHQENRVLTVLNKVTGITLTIVGSTLIAGGLVLVAVAASLRSDELMLNAGEIALVGVSAITARTFAKLCP